MISYISMKARENLQILTTHARKAFSKNWGKEERAAESIGAVHDKRVAGKCEERVCAFRKGRF